LTANRRANDPVPHYTINAELNKLLARISDILGTVVACYEEGQPWASIDVRRAIAEHAQEIDIRGVIEGRIKPKGVVVLCKFDVDRREDGSTTIRLFEFSESASRRIRSIGKARTSHGELFGHVLQ
jgi:hypothetical protein